MITDYSFGCILCICLSKIEWWHRRQGIFGWYSIWSREWWRISSFRSGQFVCLGKKSIENADHCRSILYLIINLEFVSSVWMKQKWLVLVIDVWKKFRCGHLFEKHRHASVFLLCSIWSPTPIRVLIPLCKWNISEIISSIQDTLISITQRWVVLPEEVFQYEEGIFRSLQSMTIGSG